MDREELGRKEALELCEQVVTDRLVYLVEERPDRCPEYAAWNWAIDSYVEGELWFLFVFQVHVGRDSEQFAAVVHHGVRDDEAIRVIERNRYGQRPTERKGLQRDPVLVSVVDVVKNPEVQSRPIPSVIWLYRLDDFLRLVRKLRYFCDSMWAKSIAAFGGRNLIPEDREAGTIAGVVGCDQRQLPREMIEARAQIMSDIADEYTKTHRRGSVNFQAIHAVASLRIYLEDGAVRIRTQKLPDLDVKRIKMFTCSGELCPWIVK